MKKFILTILAISLFSIASVSAQGRQTKTSKKVGAFLSRSRDVAEQTGGAISDFFGFDDRVVNKEDLIKIKGTYYMPLYSVNLYKGTDAAEFPVQCREMFARRFPLSTIISVAMPQTQWLKEEIVKSRMVVGYLQTMYCFIIARDGEDGYINARFSYKMYKEAGSHYVALEDNWPKWERTDFLSQSVYAKLLTK